VERGLEASEGDAKAPEAARRGQIFSLREALRLRERAHEHCLLEQLYAEHCLFGLARDARRDMRLAQRAARAYWEYAVWLEP